MRREELRLRLEELYRQYDHRFVTPDPLEFVRAQVTDADREVVGLLAAGLAFGTVAQIKGSIAAVLEALGPRPAEAVAGLEAPVLATKLRAFRHRWLDGRDVACLLDFARQMRASHGSVEAFFAEGLDPGDPDVGRALVSFSARALALDHGGLYRGRRPARQTPGCATSFRRPRREAPASGSTSTSGGWPAATASTWACGGDPTRRSSCCRSTPTPSPSRAGSA